VCPYCGHANTIGGGGEAAGVVEELDFVATLAEAERGTEAEETPVVACGACAAQVNKPANVDALTCPYCGSSIVATASSVRHVRPRSLLPFKVTRQEADGAFRRWLAGLWFAPSALKKQGKLDAAITGLYIPYWTYDCGATTPYTGSRGDHYYVTVPYSTTVNGRRVTRTRQERRTRWSPARGVVKNSFNDLLVVASASLSRDTAKRLEPWDLAGLVPYRDEYLSGFVAESYTVGLKDGFVVAQGMMRPVIEGTIRADIGGDEQRIESMSPKYENITFKHLLLPVWISSYRYMNKVYRFHVNARTGEVHGERPYSWVKITLAVLAGLLAVGIVVALVAGARG
jgi:DNA-directed RNA polymerase subunit RPC12/RpoP